MALGPCGCTDYHLADCPLMTTPSEDAPETQDLWYEMVTAPERDVEYDFLRDDVDIEDEDDEC